MMLSNAVSIVLGAVILVDAVRIKADCDEYYHGKQYKQSSPSIAKHPPE